jgi:hypothetical protein
MKSVGELSLTARSRDARIAAPLLCVHVFIVWYYCDRAAFCFTYDGYWHESTICSPFQVVD